MPLWCEICYIVMVKSVLTMVCEIYCIVMFLCHIILCITVVLISSGCLYYLHYIINVVVCIHFN
jgi:hypothetical protein